MQTRNQQNLRAINKIHTSSPPKTTLCLHFFLTVAVIPDYIDSMSSIRLEQEDSVQLNPFELLYMEARKITSMLPTTIGTGTKSRGAGPKQLVREWHAHMQITTVGTEEWFATALQLQQAITDANHKTGRIER